MLKTGKAMVFTYFYFTLIDKWIKKQFLVLHFIALKLGFNANSCDG